MAALASLVVSLSANIGEFASAMDKAANISNQRMNAMMDGAKKAGAAIGAGLAAGAAGMAAAMKVAIDNADELGKAAQKAGVTTEALSSLAYAADLSGVSTEQLSTGLSKLNKAAADGNGAFDAMGISVKNADGSLKSADVLLSEVAGKFAGYKDGAEKSALAMELFGKSGAEMIPLLNSGSEGLAEMTAEAQSMGLVLSKDVTDAAAAVNDNFTRMQRAQQGIVAQITAGMLPTMQNLTDKMVNAAKNSGALETASRSLAAGLKLLVSAGTIVVGVFNVVGAGIASVAAAVVAAAQGDFRQAWEILGMGGNDMVEAVRSSVDSVIGIWDESAAKARTVADAPDGGIVAPIVKAAEKAKKARQEIDKEARDAARAMERMMEEGRRITESMRTPSEALGAELVKLNDYLSAGAINWETYSRAVFSAQDAFDATVEAAEKAAKGQEDARIRARESLYAGLLTEEEDLAMSYVKRYEQIIAATEVTEVERQDLLRRLKEGFIAEQDERDRAHTSAQLQNASALFDGLAGIAASAAGKQSALYRAMFAVSKAFAIADALIKIQQGIANATSLPWPENLVAMASTASSAAGIVSKIQGTQFDGGRALGGPVQAGRSYLVGERGPERITMAGNGHVTPTEQLVAPAPQQNIRIVNAFDTSVIGDYLGSDAAEQLIMNAVQRNATTVRQLAGGGR